MTVISRIVDRVSGEIQVNMGYNAKEKLARDCHFHRTHTP